MEEKSELQKLRLEMLGLEATRLKFVKSQKTGDLISFVSRHYATRELKGVREDYPGGKQICVLCKELKEAGTVQENTLYWAEMRAMHGGKKGFVVVSVTPILFKAVIETTIIPKAIYQVSVTFGNKTIYFNPKDGRSSSCATLEGVLGLLESRQDIEDKDKVIADFKAQATILIRYLLADGYPYPSLR